MAIKEKNGNTFPHELFKVGDLVTFQWDDTLKDGIVLVVDAYGTFESPNIRLRCGSPWMAHQAC